MKAKIFLWYASDILFTPAKQNNWPSPEWRLNVRVHKESCYFSQSIGHVLSKVGNIVYSFQEEQPH